MRKVMDFSYLEPTYEQFEEFVADSESILELLKTLMQRCLQTNNFDNGDCDGSDDCGCEDFTPVTTTPEEQDALIHYTAKHIEVMNATFCAGEEHDPTPSIDYHLGGIASCDNLQYRHLCQIRRWLIVILHGVRFRKLRQPIEGMPRRLTAQNEEMQRMYDDEDSRE
jgi:hypothetical protein